MEILQNQSQIIEARKELIKIGASHIDTTFRRIMRKLGFEKNVRMGDIVKSWDVLLTLKFLEKHVEKNMPIMDIGCYASEVIAALHKVGFTNLTGADLNPNLNEMPYQDSIRYEVTNFMHTKFSDASFNAITSISVIEHGFDAQSLLKESSRLLRPGGYFIASFDYWPDKIDTTGIRLFGLDWIIFSKDEIRDFILLAKDYGLTPEGEMSFNGSEKLVDYSGKQYTFGWLVLKKTA